jgi:hypothetical protein
MRVIATRTPAQRVSAANSVHGTSFFDPDQVPSSCGSYDAGVMFGGKSMKPAPRRQTGRRDSAQQQLRAALRAQWQDAPALFSDRDDDAAECADLLREFERVHDEATGADRSN